MASPTTAYVTDLTKQTTNQMLSLYRQSLRFGWDAAQAWTEAVAGLWKADAPADPSALVPGAVRETLGASISAGLDLVESAVRIQRELLATVFPTTG